ncbi:hypothetical protein Tco_0660643 [Tanacetum coccineum]
MTTLKFADTHNMVAFLSKPTESEGFEHIVDFLNTNPIRYALTINPTICISCIEQFWSTVKAKTVNGEVQLQALVDGKKIIITKSTMRRDLQLEDAEGVDSTNQKFNFSKYIFESMVNNLENVSGKFLMYPRFIEVKTASTPIETQKPLLKDENGKEVDVHMYLKGQPKLGIWYPKDSPFDLVAYIDSDYAEASLDKKSTTGGCQFIGSRLISWQCKK